MKDTYLTIAKISEGLYKEKGSKFLGYAYPVDDAEMVKSRIEALKKKYHDARHHCYAYILGKEGDEFRANDDGEPNHSAGDPILGQIRSRSLTNTLVVIVRYFGGTKLGVSGLINAYKTAAANALDNNKIIEKVVKVSFRIIYEYSDTNEIMKAINDFGLDIEEQNFGAKCEMQLAVRLRDSEKLKRHLELMPNIQFDGEKL